MSKLTCGVFAAFSSFSTFGCILISNTQGNTMAAAFCGGSAVFTAIASISVAFSEAARSTSHRCLPDNVRTTLPAKKYRQSKPEN